MTPRQKIDAIIALMVPEIRDAFLLAMSLITDSVVIAELSAAIEAGDFERVYTLLNITGPVFRPMQTALESTYERIAEAEVNGFPARIKTPFGSMVFRFNMYDPNVVAYLRNQSGNLITAIQDDTRTTIRNTVADGQQSGRNPRSIALDIVGRIDPTTGKRVGGVVGLTKQQEMWSRSVRKKLEALDPTYLEMALRDARFDGVVRKAIEAGKALSTDTIDKLVLRYREKALKYRGEMIARNEVVPTANGAGYEAVRQVVATGGVKAGAVTREWDDVGDNRTRHDHRTMRGQTVGLDEPFVAPDGSLLMFPGDDSLGASAKEVIMCRCRVKNLVDWAYDL